MYECVAHVLVTVYISPLTARVPKELSASLEVSCTSVLPLVSVYVCALVYIHVLYACLSLYVYDLCA